MNERINDIMNNIDEMYERIKESDIIDLLDEIDKTASDAEEIISLLDNEDVAYNLRKIHVSQLYTLIGDIETITDSLKECCYFLRDLVSYDDYFGKGKYYQEEQNYYN